MAARSSASRVAEVIFGSHAADTLEISDLIGVGKRSQAELAVTVSPLVGNAGFDAMFDRCVRKTKSTFADLDELVRGGRMTLADQLWVFLQRQDPATARDILVSLFTHFLELLTSLIGEELTMRLLQNTWPGIVAQLATENS